MLFARHSLFLAFLLAVEIANVAAFARYANSTLLSIPQPTLQAFLQHIPIVSTTAASEQQVAPSASSRSSNTTSTASHSRASTGENNPAAYGTSPPASSPHLSIASGVLASEHSLRSHNATTPTASTTSYRSTNFSNVPLPLAVTSKTPAYQVTGASNLTNLTSIHSSTSIKSNITAAKTASLGNLLAAVGQIASLSGSNPASITGLAAATPSRMASSEEPTTTNALSVLLSAAPSDVAESVESAFNSLTSQLLGPTTQQTAAPSITPLISFSLTSSASEPTSSASSQISSSTSSLPTTTSSRASSTLMTVAVQPKSATSTPTPSSTIGASSNGGQHKNASVAGIATGLVAGVVLFMLAGIYLFRRRQQGKPIAFFGARGSRGSQRGSKRIFPEVAWLYDPSRTPREGSPPPQEGREMEMGHSRDPSTASLIPEPREGAIELPSAPNSPSQRPSSPLLSPPLAGGRAESPQGSRSGIASPNGRRSGSSSPGGRRSRSSLGVSRTDLTRPMSAIWEEPPRPSVDARTGLLAPRNVNMQRHST